MSLQLQIGDTVVANTTLYSLLANIPAGTRLTIAEKITGFSLVKIEQSTTDGKTQIPVWVSDTELTPC